MTAVLEALASHAIVPVVVAETADDGVRIASALADGGLPVAEITFRTPVAAEAIAAVAARGGILVGAGTVLSPAQVDAAFQAGAQYIVSPGTSRAVIERARELGLPVLPGAVTATEIQAALELGIRTVKFFPAGTSGGAPAIRALAAPFGGVSFLPTGGITAENAHEYLSIPQVIAVGGSWMLPARAIADGDWAEITRLTAQAVTLAAVARPVPLR